MTAPFGADGTADCTADGNAVPVLAGALQPPADPEPGSPTVRVRVFVDGRVQGVWFRQSAAHEAVRLEVRGWVRNLPDGRVETVYEGRREAVEEMVVWTRRGPERAVVTEMTIHDEEPKGERGFSIR